jgi:hypothetical protein
MPVSEPNYPSLLMPNATEVEGWVAESDKSKILQGNAPDLDHNPVITGLLHALIAICYQLGGFILVLSSDNAVTSGEIRSTISADPANFAIAGHDLWHVIVTQFLSVGFESTWYVDGTHFIINILSHVPLKGIILVLTHTDATDASACFPELKEINLFPTFEFGIEGLHLFAMGWVSSFEDVVDFDQNNSDVVNILVSPNIRRGEREDAPIVRVADVS